MSELSCSHGSERYGAGSDVEISIFSQDELRAEFMKKDIPAFRANQVFKWLINGESRFENMSDLPKGMRELLSDEYSAGNLCLIKKLKSKIDGTSKYIFSTDDGNIIESVFMKYKFGNTVCISTQAGCRMGCTFCASSKVAFGRNLTPIELTSQVTNIRKESNENVANVVLMGIGEPFDNYDNVIRFIKNLHDKNGLNMGYRRITISTCGIVNGIKKLIEEKIPVNLSVSLHSPFNEKRMEIMPVSKTDTIDKLISICNIYTKETMRRITFEYTLIDGVNDDLKSAYALADLLKGMLCHVNLIPLNKTDGKGTKKLQGVREAEKLQNFKKALESKKIEVTVRRSLGEDVEAACGQLRRDMIGKR